MSLKFEQAAWNEKFFYLAEGGFLKLDGAFIVFQNGAKNPICSYMPNIAHICPFNINSDQNILYLNEDIPLCKEQFTSS